MMVDGGLVSSGSHSDRGCSVCCVLDWQAGSMGCLARPFSMGKGMAGCENGSCPEAIEQSDSEPNRYEVVDGSNQRFEKRIVILTASKRDSNSTTAPVVVAEMYSARRNPMQMHNKRKQEKMRERSVGKGGRGEKGPGSNRRSRGRGGRGGRYDMPMREPVPVARLKIYDPSLDYLKEIFGKNARRGPDSLIDTNDQRSSSGSDTAEQSRKVPKEREEGVPPGVELPDEQDESFDRYEDDVQEHEEF
eukprot:765988-Hanusia_phi.AAC.31